MEQLVSIRDIFRNREEYLNKEISVGGWVRSNRDSKSFGFVIINDGTFFEPLQVVYHDTMENFAAIAKINVGCNRRRFHTGLSASEKTPYDGVSSYHYAFTSQNQYL